MSIAHSCNCSCLNASICSFLRNLIMCSLSNWSVVVNVSVKVVYSGAFERCIVVRVHVMNPEWDVASESSLVKLGTTLKGQNTLHALNDNNANKTWGIIYWVLHYKEQLFAHLPLTYFISFHWYKEFNLIWCSTEVCEMKKFTVKLVV